MRTLSIAAIAAAVCLLCALGAGCDDDPAAASDAAAADVVASDTGASASDPGTSTADPGASATDPGASSADPGTSATDPGGSTADPGGSAADPGSSTADPGGSAADPGGSSGDPGSTATPDTATPDTASADAATPAGPFADDFAGSGPLVGYTTNNPQALPDVARVDGRYRANLVDNTDNVTLHYNQDQGRLDAKLLAFPFDVVARNIGIGTQADSQVAPAPTGNPYVFAGVQVHVTDLQSRNSSHVVVGHRGGTHFTVEGKHTVDGDSSVNDDGAGIAPDGRADLRIVGGVDRALTVYWQAPNPQPGVLADAWTLYRGTGALPEPAPAYGAEVYVGLITYAFNYGGVPFVGTCDALEGGSL